MINKHEILLEKFQGNAYPAMLQDLGEHLGVSEDSLRRLALGWAPIVTFKKGPSYCGWWAIPERDANAEVVGISLRSQTDFKVMYPGSNRGLIYEVNPDHSGGEKGYSAGAHNWIRTMDAGAPCPVCEKPDGCILSAENPADPKAVVCIRIKSPRPLKFGWLHVRKPEGHLKNTSPLPSSDYPVVCVEGFSDTAAAMDLGFVAVGRPNDLARMDMLCDLLRSRPVVIVGENDRKPDGREPGKEGMITAFQALKHVCRDLRMVMPPEHIKDIRVWKAKYGLTKDQFVQYVEEKGEKQTDATVILDDRPTTIARAFLESNHRLASRYTLRRWESTWYRYAGTKYVPVKDEAFEKPVYDWAYGRLLMRMKKGIEAPVPLVANNSLLANVKQAMIAETLISENHMPCWINGAKGPNPKDLIIFANGVLDVPAYLDGDANALSDPSPDLFTTAALPISFDPTAVCPVWDAFIESSLGDETAKIELLQEWLGYCMTADTSFQKMMYFRGLSCSGKGTILGVMQELVGSEQTATPNFSELSKDFGLAPLVGKLCCLIGDARSPRYGDAARGLEVLLNISGNDAVQVNRKFKDHLESLRLTARITIASNEMLDVPDHAGAMIRRLNFIEFNRSFKDRPDYGLPAKLAAEIQGIANWALAGLRRLRERGAFTVPPSSYKALQEWTLLNSPVASFLEECTDIDPQGEVTKSELFDCWAGWTNERRIMQITTSRFIERVRSGAPYATSETYEKGGHKYSIFRGMKLKAWAAKKFNGRP